MSSAALATPLVSRQETKKLPLPLELTSPMLLADSLETVIEETYNVGEGRYNPQTQIREDTNGLPLIVNISTMCAGICGTVILGRIKSDRDQVTDD